MTENESKKLEQEEPESENSSEVEEEATSSDNKLVKAIKKKKSAVKKTKEVIRQKLLAKFEVLALVGILLLVFSWNKVEDLLHWMSGLEEITVVAKTTDNGCKEIVTEGKGSYCVDESSYDLAIEGNNYLMEENQYFYKLRAVR